MAGFGYDEELPAGFQDADFEMREMEELGNRSEYLRRKGICTHGSGLGYRNPAVYYAQEYMAPGEMLCMDCGAIFASEQDWWDAHREVMGL